jgi:hypothetical protein
MMIKGQIAMIAAMALTLEPNKSTGGRPSLGITNAAKAAGVSPARISQALTVDNFSHGGSRC